MYWGHSVQYFVQYLVYCYIFDLIKFKVTDQGHKLSTQVCVHYVHACHLTSLFYMFRPPWIIFHWNYEVLFQRSALQCNPNIDHHTERDLGSTVLAIWFNKGLCTHFSQLCGLKSSRDSSRLIDCRYEWTLEASPTSLQAHKRFNKPLLYSNTGIKGKDKCRGGGVCLPHPPVDRMTDKCKNITLSQIRCGR